MKIQSVRLKESHSAFREQKEGKSPLKHHEAGPVTLEAGSLLSALAEIHTAFREAQQHLEPVSSTVQGNATQCKCRLTQPACQP